MQIEDYFEFISKDEIRLRGTRVGIDPFDAAGLLDRAPLLQFGLIGGMISLQFGEVQVRFGIQLLLNEAQNIAKCLEAHLHRADQDQVSPGTCRIRPERRVGHRPTRA